MSALSANLIRNTRSLSNKNFVVKNASTVYAGSFVGMNLGTGHVLPLAAAVDQIYVGVAQQKIVGDGTLTCTVSIDSFILPSVAVTGSSAATNVGKAVYATTDNDLTMTRPASNVCAVGTIAKWITSTTCDVKMFSWSESQIFSSQGNGVEVIKLPVVAMKYPTTTGDVLTGFTLRGRGKIVDFFSIMDGAATGVGADITYSLEIATVAVTGGALQLTEATTVTAGEKISATAITAANSFTDGQALDIVSTVGTAFDTGKASLYIVIERQP